MWRWVILTLSLSSCHNYVPTVTELTGNGEVVFHAFGSKPVFRFENDEAVCYSQNKSGLACKWKSVENDDLEMENK